MDSWVPTNLFADNTVAEVTVVATVVVCFLVAMGVVADVAAVVG